MPALTLNQAAKAAKKSKATLLEAINSGRLSAAKNDLQQWQIEPSELFRVYPVDRFRTGFENQSETETDQAKKPLETTLLLEKLSALEEQLQMVKAERERERTHLLAQLEREQQQADHWRRQATALLTHQPEPKTEPKPEATPKPTGDKGGLFQKLFGRRGAD